MENLSHLDPMTIIVLVAAGAIMVLSLFAKFISGMMKIAIITAMVAVILYFLRQAGII